MYFVFLMFVYGHTFTRLFHYRCLFLHITIPFYKRTYAKLKLRHKFTAWIQ